MKSLFWISVFAWNGFSFTETIPVYGIVKPGKISTSLAVNHGIVEGLAVQIGSSVRRGEILLSVIEKETTRRYRSSISGQVAKVHVTQGAGLTPGMPLITVLNPEVKVYEVSLSPQKARWVSPGSKVFGKKGGKLFGVVKQISPLVDPDTGAVVAIVSPESASSDFIGDVIPLNVEGRSLSGCKEVKLQDIDRYADRYSVAATAGQRVCLHELEKD